MVVGEIEMLYPDGIRCVDSTRRRESTLGPESETGNDISSMSRAVRRGRCGIAEDLGLKKGWDISVRYLDVWLKESEVIRGCEMILQMRCGQW